MVPWGLHARGARRGVAGAGPWGFHGSAHLVQVPKVEVVLVSVACGLPLILALAIKRHAERAGAVTGAITAAGRLQG
eukprot:7184787-Lingulodinium_polyedra.AAC.1